MIVKKALPRLTIELDGAKFHFRYPNGIEWVSLTEQKTSADICKQIFGLLDKVEGVLDEEGKEVQKGQVPLVLDGGTVVQIVALYFEEARKARETLEKKA